MERDLYLVVKIGVILFNSTPMQTPSYNPIGPAPVKPAESGTQKTVAKRERRQKYRELSSQQPTMPTQTDASTPPPLPDSANSVHVLRSTPSTTTPSPTTSPKNSSIVFYNNNLNIAGNKPIASQNSISPTRK